MTAHHNGADGAVVSTSSTSKTLAMKCVVIVFYEEQASQRLKNLQVTQLRRERRLPLDRLALSQRIALRTRTGLLISPLFQATTKALWL